MKNFKCLALAGAAVTLALGAFTLPATADKHDDIGDQIREYIMDNPSIIMEALNKHQANERRSAEEAAQKAVSDNYNALTAKNLPSAGVEDADVTIVEFFDYNCGYCKRAVPDINALLEKDKNVRVVFHELPILGPSSMMAAKWALAAHLQGKYFDFHVALMDHRGGKDEAILEKLAKDVGLDVKTMKKDVGSKKVEDLLAETRRLADALGVTGTPAFIVDTNIFRGYLGPDGLQREVNKARAEAKG